MKELIRYFLSYLRDSFDYLIKKSYTNSLKLHNVTKRLSLYNVTGKEIIKASN